MKFRYKIPSDWKLAISSSYTKFLIRWFSFWKNWHYVKFYFYNSPRHLLKTRKYHRKLRRLDKATSSQEKKINSFLQSEG
ncbi:hypothetical protein DS745_11750 [Anaerobacillus alkaliphilus]|uniref:Uncharacterized protein n=1 Tax=Anaerobacillus alkaliphilus TaxID=1548597 RepID=A0A4Q0VU75_9BACI|nr:hypothetical protein DS745_11750 [Anaerobacillus alkaliphilus]